MTLQLTPDLALRLDVEQLDANFKQLTAAFDQGSGAGLLYLAGLWPLEALPLDLAFWRDFAKHFLTLYFTSDIAELTSTQTKQWLEQAPPISGGEYLSEAALQKLWQDMHAALPKEAGQWVSQLNSSWNMLGRVCLNLAENKADPQQPFAMLATYITKIKDDAKPQHTVLARLLKERVLTSETATLTKIVETLEKAAARSSFVRSFLQDQRLFQPQALTANEAHRFLADIPQMEAAGLMVRVPNWWDPKKPNRPVVSVTVGAGEPNGVGLGALLSFKASLSLHGKPLSKEEWEELQKATSSLIFMRGQWVEADPEKLNRVLASWERAENIARQGQMTLAQAIRLLAGNFQSVRGEPALAAAQEKYSEIVPGAWLEAQLKALREPATKTFSANDCVNATLRPYQEAGVNWLWQLHQLGFGGCLADDMGLGKTLQVLAFLALLKQQKKTKAGQPHLIVAPATLLANWRAEAARFTPQLRVLIAHASTLAPSELTQASQDLSSYDIVVVTYGALLRFDWLFKKQWSVVVLDEAQAIKNPESQQTRAVKSLRSEQRLALTGTPIENKPLDLWSIFDFLNPGLLGSATAFNALLSAQSYSAVRTLIMPFLLRRLKTDKTIIADLPEKIELDVSCGLVPKQAAIYQRVVNEMRRDLEATADQPDSMQRKGAILSALLKLKQVCNHPDLATGQSEFDRQDSGKFLRLIELAEEIAARQEKLLVFTQFKEMTTILARELTIVFGRAGLVLHGGTPVKERQALVTAFQDTDHPQKSPPFLVLSVKAGGTGLTLTAASHVIHFDRWWNPAVEDQATDRAYRIGQRRNVLVHKFACFGTVEARVDALLKSKRLIAREVLSGEGLPPSLTELSNRELFDLVRLEVAFEES